MEKKFIPILRFSEFRENWERTKIGNILKIDNGKDYKHLGTGNIPVYGSGGYMLSVNNFLYDGESVCIGRKGTINKPIFLKNKFWAVDTLFYTHSFKNVIPKYIYYLFEKINWNKYNETSGIPSLAKGTIEKIKINLPSLIEQKKIADFLSVIDSKINSLEIKKELLKDYQKGIMQKIFSQEIRFKNDNKNEYPKWKEQKLGKVYSIVLGDSPDSNSYNKEKNGIPLIQGNADITNGISNPRNYTTAPSKKLCDIGDILMTVRAPVGFIGKSYHHACIGRGICSIKSKNNFIYYYLLNYEPKWSKISQVSTFKSINSSDIKNLSIMIPHIKEQEKIIDFLFNLDLKIKNSENLIESNKTFKKGLLQQMLKEVY